MRRSTRGSTGARYERMTTFTAAVLLDRVREEGDYENSAVFTDAVMLPWLSTAHGEFCDLIDEEWEGYRDATQTLATVAGTATVTPAAFLKVRAVHLQYGGVYRALQRFEPSRQTLGYDESTGIPVGYIHVSDALELFPTPDAAYTLRIRYVPQATAITATSDTIAVPNGWEDFHVAKVLLKCAAREERDLPGPLATLADVRARVKRAAAHRNVAGPKYLPFPTEGAGEWP